jgi:hypothetical protein
MYKEFRDLSRADAVKSLYQDMAARHRARFRSIHVRARMLLVFYLTFPCRSCVSLRSKSLRTSAVRTSSSS